MPVQKMQKKEKPKHLGRGLASLLGPIKSGRDDIQQLIEEASVKDGGDSKFPQDKQLRESLREVNLEDIHPNPYQPRSVWNQKELEDLAESIKANGIIQPIVVRRSEDKFEIIAGERRFRASRLAGLETIPAIIRTATDEELLELALVENIHRTNLNPIERAKAYKSYIETFSISQTEAASRLGEDRSVVANYLRLLDLPEEIKQMLANSELAMGHARAILALPTDQLRRKLANRAMAGRLSVREVERLVRKCLTGTEKTKNPAKVKFAHILDLERQLSNKLGTKVVIDTRKNGQRGRIGIEFYTLDEFERITEKIGLAYAEDI